MDATTLCELESQNLMEALLQREPQALHALYVQYRGLLHTVAMNVVHNACDAEEIMQDVFIHIWNRAETYSADKGKVTGWLVLLARRRAIDRLRQQASYQRATSRFEVECAESEVEAHANFDKKTCQDDLRNLLKQQLNRLPPAQKQVVELAFFESMSQREIAAATQLPLGTVKTRIELGLRKLGNILLTARLKIS